MLAPCPRCHRHVKNDAPCPFCTCDNRGSVPLYIMGSLAVVGTAILLAACYGPPPSDGSPCDEPDADPDTCQTDAGSGDAAKTD